MIPRALAPARRRVLVLVTALAVALAGALTVAAPASAAPKTLEGVVRLVADAPGLHGARGRSGEPLVLVVGDQTISPGTR